jgi:hypothetical protein
MNQPLEDRVSELERQFVALQRFIVLPVPDAQPEAITNQIGAIFDRDHAAILNALARLQEWRTFKRTDDRVAAIESQFAKLVSPACP